MNTNTNVVNAQNVGWIAAAGIAAIFFSLVMSWAMNDKYSFAIQQIQQISDDQGEIIATQRDMIQTYKADKKALDDRVQLLELQIQQR